MPLVAIHLAAGSPAHRGVEAGDAVHAALVDALGVPPDDHFQIIRQGDTLIYDESYLGIRRFISLVEVGSADFSFGGGIAQYADATPPHLATGADPGGGSIRSHLRGVGP